jgi:Abnormal spindle-like microcephaly-assoc'd, ASPM-SPD-2-Hydin
MDLSSRWDRGAVLFILIAVGAMVGCQGLLGGTNSSTQNGRLVAGTASLDFGTVVIGSSKTLTDTITNASAANVSISSSAASNADFRITAPAFPLVLSAGQSASLTLVFTPHAAGQPSGKVAIMSDAAGSSEIDLMVGGKAVSAGKLVTSPATVSFGQVRVGQTQTQTATLTNSGGTSVMVSQASASNSAFALSGLSMPLTLTAGQSTTFTVTFAPKATGTVNANVSVNGAASLTMGDVSGPSDPESAPTNAVITVSGSGSTAGQLGIAPTSLGFGNVTVGSSQSLTATLTNSGGSGTTISQAAASGTGFNLSGLSLPLTLSPGQSASFTVTFAPQAGGNSSGNVSLTSSGGALNLPLTGNGVSAGSLAAYPASIVFGSVQIGSTQTKTIALTNGSSGNVTVSQVSASGKGFSVSGVSLPLVLMAGQSTTFTATFAPTASGSVTGGIAVTSTASNPSLNLPLSGSGATPGTLSANPLSIGFGNVQVGVAQSRSETITNTGGATLHISQASLSGAGFSMNGLTVPTSLNAGQSLTFNLVFTPTASGNSNGSLALAADGTVPGLSVSLTGTGASPGQLAVAPGTFSFGDVTVGTSQNKTGTLTASGASVTVSSAASTNPEFTLSGISFPAMIAAGQSATFTVTFAPQASGAASGNISFVSNATNGPWGTAASGNGAPAPQHSVNLSWNASPSTVSSYNVYRGSQTGGPYVEVNSTPGASTSYVDNSVTAGQTYYYVVTAVDSGGAESVYSNQVQAVIPTP